MREYYNSPQQFLIPGKSTLLGFYLFVEYGKWIGDSLVRYFLELHGKTWFFTFPWINSQKDCFPYNINFHHHYIHWYHH